MSENQWGGGDIFARHLDPDDTVKNYPEQRIDIGVPHTGFHKIMQGMWKAIAILGTIFILLLLGTIIIGAVFGIISGIASVM